MGSIRSVVGPEEQGAVATSAQQGAAPVATGAAMEPSRSSLIGQGSNPLENQAVRVPSESPQPATPITPNTDPAAARKSTFDRKRSGNKTPRTEKKLSIDVKARGISKDTRFRRAAICTSAFDGEPFISPTCVTVWKDTVAVLDVDMSRIHLFTNKFKQVDNALDEVILEPLLSFGQHGSGFEELHRPTALCLTKDGSILVSDTGNNRLQLFNAEGKHLSSVGGPGSELGQFQMPKGLCVDNESGTVYVCDQGNRRVQILNENLVAVGSFGSALGEDGTPLLVQPECVTITGEKDLVVGDTSNGHINIFTPKGQFLVSIANEVNEHGTRIITEPFGLCAFGRFQPVVFVCDKATGVHLFSGEQETAINRVVTSVGQALLFEDPTSVAVRLDGRAFFVCDRSRQRLQVFAPLWEVSDQRKLAGAASTGVFVQ